jgi:hypothetical protein
MCKTGTRRRSRSTTIRLLRGSVLPLLLSARPKKREKRRKHASQSLRPKSRKLKRQGN